MADLNMYLGIPGALEVIACPKGATDQTRIRQVDVFSLANGGMRVQKLLGGARRHTINYARLGYNEFKVLEAYDQGHKGPGPFVLLSPGIRNILTPNQSGTTSERNNTNGFTLSGTGASIDSSSAAYRRGPRALRWVFAASGTPAGTAVGVDTPSTEWAGFPVHVGRSVVLSCYAKGGGTDGAVGFQLDLRWLSTAGATLSTTNGSVVTTNSAAWQQAICAGTPPASAAYVLPILRCVSGIAVGDIVYIDELMLHEGSTPDTTWDPGGGILPVAPISVMDAWPYQAGLYRERPTAIFQEVGGGV